MPELTPKEAALEEEYIMQQQRVEECRCCIGAAVEEVINARVALEAARMALDASNDQFEKECRKLNELVNRKNR